MTALFLKRVPSCVLFSALIATSKFLKTSIVIGRVLEDSLNVRQHKNE